MAIYDVLGKNGNGTDYYFDNNRNTVSSKIIDLIDRMRTTETELFINTIAGTSYQTLTDRLDAISRAIQVINGENGTLPLIANEISEAHTSSVI